MANSGEYKSRVGLDSLYIAEVTADSSSGYTADTPQWLAPAAEASIEPATSHSVQYADDQAYDVAASEAESKIALKITGLDMETLALITGKVFDSSTGRLYDNDATPPDMALGFRSKKSNGSYRYYWFLKGKFSMPKEAMKTLAEKPEPQTLELTYTTIRTIYEFDLGDIDDTVKSVWGDDDTTNFDETGWWLQVQVPGVVTPSALALSSSVPTDGASGVSKTNNITLTFNNALPPEAVYSVVLLKASDASKVASAITLDSTAKIVTINPDASLDGTTSYIVAYTVTDVYAQTLSGAINFETTS